MARTAAHAEAGGRYADTWNSFAAADELADATRSSRLLRGDRARPSEHHAVRCITASNQSLDEDPWASVDAFHDYIGRYAEAGMVEFILQLPRSGDLAIVERIASDILPAR